MGERVNTGGTKSFNYTSEDLERIRKTDTEPTKEFKTALSEHYATIEERKRKNHKLWTIIIVAIIIALFIIGLVWLRSMFNIW